MGRVLAKAVAVLDDRGELHKFKPGDEAPEWLEAKVTNPAVWGDDADEDEPRSVPTSELEPAEDDAEDTPPPLAGRGSGRDAWVTYAETNGVGVTDDMSRDDIVKACELAEIPVS